MLAAILGALLVVAIATVITLVCLTASWLSKKVKDRLAENERHKVAFVEMREVIDSDAMEQIRKKEGISMSELEKMCQDNPYVMADYDIDTGECSNYIGIKADDVEDEVRDAMKEEGGIVVFS
jgi:hypothetical protein